MSFDRKISLVIVTYNSEKYILKNLSSVYQYASNIINQIIVSDSNSSDNTLKIVEENFPDIEIIKGENKGYGAALNAGFRKCKNDYIIGSNDDIYLIDNTILEIFEKFSLNPNVGIIGPKLLYEDLSLQRSITNNPNIIKDFFQIIFPSIVNTNNYFFRNFVKIFQNFFSTGRFDDHKNSKIVNAVKGAFFVLKKEVFLESKGFDERIVHDIDEQIFCFRAKKKGWDTMYDPSINIVHIAGVHLGNPSSQSNKKRFSVRIQSSLLFYKYYQPYILYLIYYFSILIALMLRGLLLVLLRSNDRKTIYFCLKLFFTNTITSAKIYGK